MEGTPTTARADPGGGRPAPTAARSDRRLAWLQAVLVSAFVAGAGFIAAIVAGVGGGVTLHESAASILLALLGIAVVISYRLPRERRRPLSRIVVALVGLGTAAGLGGSLAARALPAAYDGLPLLPLAVMLAAIADGIRVCRASAPPATSGTVGAA